MRKIHRCRTTASLIKHATPIVALALYSSDEMVINRFWQLEYSPRAFKIVPGIMTRKHVQGMTKWLSITKDKTINTLFEFTMFLNTKFSFFFFLNCIKDMQLQKKS